MTNKINFQLAAAMTNLEASGQNDKTLSFFFRTTAGFKRDATGNPLNDDGTPVDGINIRSAPRSKTDGIYTADGTLDGIRALNQNPHVVSLSGSTQLKPLTP